MENIIINGLLYKCKNGTRDKIREALKKGAAAPKMDHEMGVAYNDFNNLIEQISQSHRPVFVDGIYETH